MLHGCMLAGVVRISQGEMLLPVLGIDAAVTQALRQGWAAQVCARYFDRGGLKKQMTASRLAFCMLFDRRWAHILKDSEI